MFNSPIVFVLGAGASCEVGLPVGSQLAETISKRVDIRFEHGHRPLSGGDWRLYDTLKQKFPSENQAYQRAGWAIRNGVLLANSIDDFLDRHSADARIMRYGKMAIVASILEAERKSKLFVDRSRKRDRSFIVDLQDTWYPRFVKILGAGVSAQNVDRLFENVSFIDFNYDRCLPQFLISALQPLYGLDENRAQQIVSKAKIFHPYGSVGDLPTVQVTSGVPFGDPDENADLFGLSDRIRIYTEQVQDHDVVDDIRQTIRAAKSVVFLGYAYYEQNMKLITPTEDCNAKRIFGTAFGISQSDCAVIQDSLGLLLDKSLQPFQAGDNTIAIRNDLTCSQFLADYPRTLAASY